ncbi:MAG: hypothetical protein M0Q24_01095 [Sulfurimonas sp.]|uniref:hypothetical protein n=1 Tax=Sulfurimonas sp. TaxID=2022749 RepID=UPI0025D3785D|nr:hypothetical protein [Sulfurimonas sp.]MCK9490657.1 hypothetical protein [Sulfurimonas sp.]
MSLSIILGVGVVLSIIFHFVGVYAGAKKIVWIAIVLIWAASINIAMSEIKPSGYKAIEKMKGQFSDTDALIEEAGESISVYELVLIKNNYATNNPKR